VIKGETRAFRKKKTFFSKRELPGIGIDRFSIVVPSHRRAQSNTDKLPGQGDQFDYNQSSN
jgi:hypothetical protein